MSTTTVPPDLDHPVTAAARAVRTLVAPIAGPAGAELWRLADQHLLSAFTELQAAAAAVEALRLQVLGEIDRRRVTEHEYELLTAAWVRSTRAQARRTASRDVTLARALTGRFTATATAMADGRISSEQADAVVTVLDDLPVDLAADQVQHAETSMLGFAAQYDPSALRTLTRHLLDVIAPEIAERADAARLEREEREAHRTRYLSLVADGQGSLLLKGKLPAVAGEMLRTVVEAIAAHDDTGHDVDDRGGDRRRSGQRRADALISIVHGYLQAGHGPDHGGDRPRITVHLDYATLAAGVGPATLDSGQSITAGQARRLACDADILPMVLGGRSQPLDVGRQRRLFTGGLRQALVARDRGCVFPGCDRPPRDCDSHHLVPWWDGGSTSLLNGVLLCPHHHRVIEPDRTQPEHERWHMRMGIDGYPDTIPPARLDPRRAPIRHQRHPQRQ